MVNNNSAIRLYHSILRRGHDLSQPHHYVYLTERWWCSVLSNSLLCLYVYVFFIDRECVCGLFVDLLKRPHVCKNDANPNFYLAKPVTEHYSGIDVSTEEHQS